VRRVAHTPATPLLTYYDIHTGERVELSGATFATWAAKISHLLRDEVGLAPGERVGLLTRPHWLPLAVCAGVWAAGGAPVVDLVPGQDAELAAVALTCLDGDILDRPPAATAGEVLAVSTRPMAAPYGEALPPGVLDLVAAARAHPDTLVVTPPPSPGQPDDWVGAARRRADATKLAHGVRVLVAIAGEPTDCRLGADLVRDALVVPLLLDGSAVVVWTGERAATGEATTSSFAPIVAAERVDVVLDVLDVLDGG